MDKIAQVWEASSGVRLLTYERHREGIDTLAWSPNGLYPASGGDDQTIDIWDAQSGRTLQTYHGHTSVMRAVSWSPDGLFIASGGSDDTVQIWRAHIGEHLLTYQGHPAKSRGVFVVAWSPSDMVVASGSKEKTIHLWDGRDGRPISFYQGHCSKVFSLAWLPNGKLIASGMRRPFMSGRWQPANGSASIKRIVILATGYGLLPGPWMERFSSRGATIVQENMGIKPSMSGTRGQEKPCFSMMVMKREQKSAPSPGRPMEHVLPQEGEMIPSRSGPPLSWI